MSVHFFLGRPLTDTLSSADLTTYSYDAAHRLTTMSQSFGGSAGPQVAFGYDAGNRLTSIDRTIGRAGTDVASVLGFDAANRLTTLTHQTTGSGGTTLASYLYGYDPADQLSSETNAEGTVSYAYDSGGELTGVTGARSEAYSYDLSGNRTGTGYSTGTGNELTAGGGYTYTYDNEGNLTEKTQTATGTRTDYTWDYRNRLTGVTVTNSGGTVTAQETFTYDVFDRRIGTLVDPDGAGPQPPVQTWTVYDGDNP